LFEAAHPYVQLVDIDIEHPDNQSVTSDGIKPEDSASNISFLKENNSRLHWNKYQKYPQLHLQ